MVKPHQTLCYLQPKIRRARMAVERCCRVRFAIVSSRSMLGRFRAESLSSLSSSAARLRRLFAKAMVDVMNELQMQRQQSKLFAGKDGFITPRDLLKWAERQPLSYKELAVNGYRLLAERVRNDAEKEIVKRTEKYCKTKLSEDIIYRLDDDDEGENGDWTLNVTTAVEQSLQAKHDASAASSAGIKRIVWTNAMRRVFSLLHHCVKNKEPVLLVGATGIGKTTVCQFHALFFRPRPGNPQLPPKTQKPLISSAACVLSGRMLQVANLINFLSGKMVL